MVSFHLRLLFLLACCLASNASAQEPRQTGAPLYDQIANSTLTGWHTGGTASSEYHAPDGRVFGYNNGEPALDACWRTAGPDVVCYYYGTGVITGEFCWRLDPMDANGYRLTATDGSGSTGLFRRENGNPYDFNDHGRHWTCDALMSSAPVRRVLIARFKDPIR